MSSSHGTFAAFVWTVVGVILYIVEPETRVISWQTPVYFLVGMFGAGAVFGNLSHIAVQGMTHALIRAKIVTQPTRRAQIGLLVTGYVLFALEAVLIYYCARTLLRVMFQV